MDNKKHIGFKVDAEVLEKFTLISKYNGRSITSQLQFMMRMLIRDFEHEHGEITCEDIKSLYENK